MAEKMLRVAARGKDGTAKAISANNDGNLLMEIVGSNTEQTPFLKESIDYFGKKQGVTFDFPMFSGTSTSDTFKKPTESWTELTTEQYKSISIQDDNLHSVSTAIDGQYAQVLYSINILTILKNRGLIPKHWTTKELGSATKRMDLQWRGFGVGSENGLKKHGMQVERWIPRTESWAQTTYWNNAVPETINIGFSSDFESLLDSNGYLHVLIHSRFPSDGSIASEIFTDYVKLDVQFIGEYSLTDASKTYDSGKRAQRVIDYDLHNKIDELSNKIDSITSHNTMITALNKNVYVPSLSENTHIDLQQQRENAKLAYLHSEKVLSIGTADEWYLSPAGAGTLESDSMCKESGFASLKITTGEVQFSPYKWVGGDFSEDTHIRLWVKIDDISKLDTLKLAVNAPDGNNQFIFSLEKYIKHRSGGPCVITMSKGEATTHGNPSWKNIGSLFAILKATAGNTVTAWIDNIKMQRTKVKKGKVILRFDDGLKSQYDVAMPILVENGLVGSAVINPAFIGGRYPGYGGGRPSMSIEDIRHLQTLGWDISSHAWDSKSFSNRNYQQSYHDFRATQNWLIENGFSKGARFHVFPNHDLNEQSLKAANDIFSLDFSGVFGLETLPWGDSNINYYGGDNSDFGRLKWYVDAAAQHKGLTVINFHMIEEGGADYSIDPAILSEFVQHLAKREDVNVITFSDLLDRTAIALE